ncbi:DNA double-strand break repair ATPase Rad50 [Sulfurisphaera javensis]|uniref:DNA double-strand break repair Rad50 ATPase n=1 Tax=Sulfurisphaera javensis TaxID=2049879 RepID=A0AAT9GNY9_9CREN
MIIRKIELKDFLSHKDTTIEFNGTINVIIGHNGAGKSSIIDSIMFGLFRKPLRDVRKQEDLIRKGSSRGSVILTLENKGVNYTIKRYLQNRGGSTEDTISIKDQNGSKTLGYGAQNVTQKIKEMLNLDDEVLRSTIVVGQGKIDSVFENLPNTIKAILKLDKIEKLRDSNGPIKELIDEIQLEIKNLNTIEEWLKKYIQEKKEKEQRLTFLKNELSTLSKKEEEVSKRYDEIKKRVEIEEEKERKYSELNSLLGKLNEEISRLEKEIEKEKGLKEEKEKLSLETIQLDQLRREKEKLIEIQNKFKLLDSELNNYSLLIKDLETLKEKLNKKKEFLPYYNEYQQIEEKIATLEEKEKEYDTLLKQIQKLENDIEQIKAKIMGMGNIPDPKKIEEEIEKLNKEIEEKSRQKEDLNNQIGEIKGKISELNRILENLNEVKGNTCPVCGRELDAHHKIKISTEIKVKTEELKKELQNKLLELNSISKLISDYNQKINEKRKEQQIAIKKSSDYESLNSRKEELIKEREKIYNRIEELKQYHELYNELKKKEKELRPKYEEYLKYSDVDEDKIKEKEEQVAKLKEEIEKLKKETSGYDKNTIGEQIKNIEKKIKDLEEKKNRLNEIEKELAVIEKYKQILVQDKEQVVKLKTEIENLNFDENKLKELKNTKDEIEKKLNDIRIKKGEVSGEINAIENSIREIDQKIKELEGKLKNKQTLLSAFDKLKKLRDELSETNLQAYLMNTVRNLVEDSLNNILSRFDLAFSRVEVDFNGKEGIYAYNTSGQRLSINQLSGGERVSIALALRLALAKSLMNEVGFLILDEPTVNLDEYRKRELIDIIRSTVEVVPQIIVVTHDEELLQAGDYVIKVEKKGDSSKIEVINVD